MTSDGSSGNDSGNRSSYTITLDKTWQEIYNAIMLEGKTVYIRTNDEDGVLRGGYPIDDITPIQSIGSNPDDDLYYLEYYYSGIEVSITMECSSPNDYPTYTNSGDSSASNPDIS